MACGMDEMDEVANGWMNKLTAQAHMATQESSTSTLATILHNL